MSYGYNLYRQSLIYVIVAHCNLCHADEAGCGPLVLWDICPKYLLPRLSHSVGFRPFQCFADGGVELFDIMLVIA